MRKTIAIVLVFLVMLSSISSFAEEEPSTIIEDDELEMYSMGAIGGEVTGDFDEPALTHPEERYEEYFVDETDGSETPFYYLLDVANDEAKDIEKFGALYITEHQQLTEQGQPLLDVRMSIQECPYGKIIIYDFQFPSMKLIGYTINHYAIYYDGEIITKIDDDYNEDAYKSYCESFHFPYGSLKALRGVRQDENGYNYLFIRSDKPVSFEFVVGEELRILQIRVYVEDEDGVLKLVQYSDYDVGPAWEIPQVVLDAMGEVLEPITD